MAAKPLTFDVVDDLSFAAVAGRLDGTRAPRTYIASRLGPLLELLYLAATDRLPSRAATWLVPNGATGMVTALRQNREGWISTDRRRMGFIRPTRRDADGDDALLTGFLMDAQRGARGVAGLPGTQPGQLVAAMRELESNIHEHSEAPETGILAFRAAQGVFEFVAADRGIGILESLRKCHTYSVLSDHGRAIESALTDGHSRFGESVGRGHGFRPLFLGLVNLYGSLRFRSGDHALVIDGTNPQLATARIGQKAPIDGFLVSVRCETRRPDAMGAKR